MLDAPLRFGIFLAPFHPIDENPALALERDFQLVEHLDRLGYDEAWIGEHHSAGYETIASPEVFIAAAGERTRRIRLGTGVSSLPYHHPFILADRVQQLDYQLKGRFMFGVGPGSLPSDAFMMGIDPLRQRDMMEEALDVLIPLLRGEAVTKITDWFSVKEARLQLMPYTRPHVEMAVAAQISPAGPRAAGKHGIGMLSIGSTTSQGYMALSAAWGCSPTRSRRGLKRRRLPTSPIPPRTSSALSPSRPNPTCARSPPACAARASRLSVMRSPAWPCQFWSPPAPRTRLPAPRKNSLASSPGRRCLRSPTAITCWRSATGRLRPGS